LSVAADILDRIVIYKKHLTTKIHYIAVRPEVS